MGNPTTETYVPLSRGLIDHLPGMAKGCRLALYVYLIINARYSGSHKGKFASSFADISLFLGVHYKTVWKAAQWLKEKKYIAYVGAKNQHDVTIFTITKYKTVEDFVPGTASESKDLQDPPPTALSRAYGPETQSEVKARSKRGQSRPRTASESNDLQGPNNVKECKDIYTVEIEEVFDAYKVIMEVRSRSDSRKSKIRARLKEYGKSEVLRAIENYHHALDDPGHYFTYRFPIERFMEPENIDRFLGMEPPAEEEWPELPDGAGFSPS